VDARVAPAVARTHRSGCPRCTGGRPHPSQWMPALHRRWPASLPVDARVAPAVACVPPTGYPRRTGGGPRPSHPMPASYRRSPVSLCGMPALHRRSPAPIAVDARVAPAVLHAPPHRWLTVERPPSFPEADPRPRPRTRPGKRYDPSVPPGSVPPALLIVACAMACVGRASAPVPPLEAELPPPPEPYLRPPPAVHLEPAGQERESHPDVHHLCARDAMAGLQLCQSLAPGDPSACAEVCLEDYRVAHAPRPLPVRAPPAPPPTVAPAAQPPQPPDPFTLALGDCVRRVREGTSEPACHFYRPLDSMGFGQTHCDAKCSELTAGYRARHVDAGP
jgi:hypothetical protein